MCALASRVLFRGENGYSSAPSLPSPEDRLKKGLSEACVQVWLPTWTESQSSGSPCRAPGSAEHLVLSTLSCGRQQPWAASALCRASATLVYVASPLPQPLNPVQMQGCIRMAYPNCLLSKQKHTGHMSKQEQSGLAPAYPAL